MPDYLADVARLALVRGLDPFTASVAPGRGRRWVLADRWGQEVGLSRCPLPETCTNPFGAEARAWLQTPEGQGARHAAVLGALAEADRAA